MQRNLGANAGLDYREMTDFLATISQREEDALNALYMAGAAEGGGAVAGGPPGSAGGRGCISSVDATAEMEAPGRSDGVSVEGEARVHAHVDVHVEGPQASPVVGSPMARHAMPGQQPACSSFAQSGGSSQHQCGASVCPGPVAGLWSRRDAGDVILRHVHGTEQQAAALQHLLNLRRAGLVLRELKEAGKV